MSDFFFNFIGFTLLGAVAIVLIMGIYTLFKGGSTSKKFLQINATKGAFTVCSNYSFSSNGLFFKRLDIFF